MIPNETIADFYRSHPAAKGLNYPLNNQNDQGHFNVFSRVFCNKYTSYSSRDFYKISLIIGTGKLFYANQVVEIDRNALVFFNKNVPYSWQSLSAEQDGYFCLFTDEFLGKITRSKQNVDCPIIRPDTIPVYFINEEQQKYLHNIFTLMKKELESGYLHKYDLIRNLVNIISHEAMKMQPSYSFESNLNGAARISNLFKELLERQFPIDSPEHKLQLKTPKDFASQLGIHVNHLNRALKEATGKTTTEHILERILSQAKLMLRFSNWSVSEIAYCLGFEYSAYFNNTFKKQLGVTPKYYRLSKK